MQTSKHEIEWEGEVLNPTANGIYYWFFSVDSPLDLHVCKTPFQLMDLI
jgi:uncharacterized protein (DUF2147 family)